MLDLLFSIFLAFLMPSIPFISKYDFRFIPQVLLLLSLTVSSNISYFPFRVFFHQWNIENRRHQGVVAERRALVTSVWCSIPSTGELIIIFGSQFLIMKKHYEGFYRKKLFKYNYTYFPNQGLSVCIRNGCIKN